MKSTLKIFGIAAVSFSMFSCTNSETKTTDATLKDLRDSASYAIGLSFGSDLIKSDLDSLNIEAIVAGFEDAKDPESFKLKTSEVNLTIQNYIVSENARKFESVKKEGEDFLAENAKKEGVKTTESGLQYKIIKQGNGPMINLFDTVTVHYHLSDLNRKVIQSTKGAVPYTFQYTGSGFIQGWLEALNTFPQGTTVELYIPQELAYGSTGNQGIKPYQALIFELEIVDVKPGKKPEFDPSMYNGQM